MARLYVISIALTIGLYCLHSPAALAAAPVPGNAPPQPSDITPLTPQQAPEEGAPLDAKAQQPIPGILTTPAIRKKPSYMAETITMQHAWIRSALVPGWGQVYNEHYWKAPAMYAVFGALGWGVVYNHKVAQGYHSESPAGKDARRSRDLCAIFMGLLYIANVFDAYVGASLKTFNLSDDISMEVQPHIIPGTQDAPTVGFSLSFKF